MDRPLGWDLARRVSVVTARRDGVSESECGNRTMVLAADRGRAMMKLYHGSSFALAALVPAAAVAPGGNLPVDLALGAALPVHSHIALNFVRVVFD